jgi:hypothetical protein
MEAWIGCPKDEIDALQRPPEGRMGPVVRGLSFGHTIDTKGKAGKSIQVIGGRSEWVITAGRHP